MASFSLQRVLRFMRSVQYMIAVFGFSCLLTFIFILYQPTAGPGIIQHLGWQSWETISSATQARPPRPTQTPSSGSSTNPDVDWWNVTGPQHGDVDSASFPLDVWAPLLPHDTGLSEIAITRCMFEGQLVEMCTPSSTKVKDSTMGKWVRVERNLNQAGGMWHLNVYYRRTRRLDVPLVIDLRLLPEREVPSPFDQHWHKVSLSIRDGQPRASSLFLWYRLGKTLHDMTPKERKEQLITELDVLFGADRPWYGFEKLTPPTTLEQEGKVESAWLTYRRGVKPPPKAPPLHFSRNGTFKILQIADLHYSVSRGSCLDTTLSPCTHSDNLTTTTLLGSVIDAEKPDLVVFTGDQLNGQGTSWDPKSVLAKFAAAVTDRGLPWAAVFGNHDDEEENGVPKEELMKLMRALPYNLVEPGPKDVHGVGNYVLKVMSADASKTHLLTLYFLDSGSYSRGFYNWWGWFTPTEYDWIRQSQIDWFLQESASIEQIQRPFSPDTGKDLAGIWKEGQPTSHDQITPHKVRLAKPNALMFFHIPLQEAYSRPDVDPTTGKQLDVGTHGLEGPGAPKRSDGFWEKGLLKAKESDYQAGRNRTEVKAVANGHCHITDNCKRISGIWLCFGGGGSYSAYGKIGFDRRFRIYDISDYGETIRTWKRTEKGEILDEMVLAGIGALGY